MPYYRCAACGLTTYSAGSYSSASACSACLEALPDDAKLLTVPRTRSADAPLVAGGRGIAIVGGLLEKWGADSTGDGCIARCQVAVEQQPLAGVVPAHADTVAP